MFNFFRKAKVYISPNISIKSFNKKEPPFMVSMPNISTEMQTAIKKKRGGKLRKTPLSKGKKNPRKARSPTKKKVK